MFLFVLTQENYALCVGLNTRPDFFFWKETVLFFFIFLNIFFFLHLLIWLPMVLVLACGILVPHWGSNLQPLHCKAESQPLDYEGSPSCSYIA